jgi:hypothetical protein
VTIETEIHLDFGNIGPELSNQERHAIRAELKEVLRSIGATLTVQSEPSVAKSAALTLITGLSIASTAIAGSYTLGTENTNKIVQTVWRALKKHLSKGTKIVVKNGTLSLEVDTYDENAEALLLRAQEAAVALAQAGKSQSRSQKRVITLSPRRR